MCLRKLVAGCALIAVVSIATGEVQARDEWYDHYERALAAIDTGKPQAAVGLLESALERKSKSGYLRTYGNNYVRYAPRFYLGVAYHALGDCDQALQQFAESDARNETERDAELAELLKSLRSACEWVAQAPAPVEAEPAVNETSEPEEPPLQVDGAQLERGLRAYLGGDLELAVRLFQQMAEQEPRSARLQLFLGMALHNAWVVGGEAEPTLVRQSERALRTASSLNPSLVPDPAICPPRVVALYRQLR